MADENVYSNVFQLHWQFYLNRVPGLRFVRTIDEVARFRNRDITMRLHGVLFKREFRLRSYTVHILADSHTRGDARSGTWLSARDDLISKAHVRLAACLERATNTIPHMSRKARARLIKIC